MTEHKTRKRWRRKALAELFGVNDRTIDGWAKKGILPPPHYLAGSPIPFWDDAEIAKITTTIKSKTVTA
jgi:hypothetical protein